MERMQKDVGLHSFLVEICQGRIFQGPEKFLGFGGAGRYEAVTMFP